MVQRHKKTSKTGLTTSGKKQRCQPSEVRVDCLDGLRDCLETIGTLAGLLEATGSQAELVRPETVSHAGKLMAMETAKAHEWLDKLEEAR